MLSILGESVVIIALPFHQALQTREALKSQVNRFSQAGGRVVPEYG
jgi:hypothetical protein